MATKKIGEKTAGISLAGFTARPGGAATALPSSASSVPPALTAPGKAYTGAGIFMSAMSGKDAMSRELADTQQRLNSTLAELQQWNGATLVRRLDPRTVGSSKWANRNEGSFVGAEWEAFKEEIRGAGGNVQPIKVRSVRPANTSENVNVNEGVRPANTFPIAYEIIYGHRRHRACLELGLPVSAMVEDVTDQELFEQMDRENRNRADLTIYEQGEMYRQALDQGLYSSLRKLSESLGVGLGNASECVAVARLPVQVLDSFESRLDIQRRWAGPLASALQKDPDGVLALAAAIRAERGGGGVVKSVEVFKRLTIIGGSVSAGASSILVQGGEGRVGKIGFNSKKQSFEITIAGLDASRIHAVEKAIKTLIS